jgi:organic radical activating enzyme
LGKVLDFDDDYNELVLTGGEPLLYHDFLKDFIPAYRKVKSRPVYLETNGVLFN